MSKPMTDERMREIGKSSTKPAYVCELLREVERLRNEHRLHMDRCRSDMSRIVEKEKRIRRKVERKSR